MTKRMKRNLLLMLCIAPLCMAAQNTLEIGRVWHFTETLHYLDEDDSDAPDGVERNFTVTVVGESEDTDGVIICKAYDNDGINDYLKINDISFSLVEKDNAVYDVWQAMDTDKKMNILLDFNLHKGDKFNLQYEGEYPDSQGEELFIIDEDIIAVKGREYRRLTVGTADGKVLDYWVDGIGSMNGLYITQLPDSLWCTKGGVPYYSTDIKLVSVYDNNTLIFEGEDFYRNTSDRISIIGDCNPDAPQLYDLQGRKLYKEPSSGIFIKDGKKVVR